MKKVMVLLVLMLALVGCGTKDVPTDEDPGKTPPVVEKDPGETPPVVEKDPGKTDTDKNEDVIEGTVFNEEEVAEVKEELKFEQIIDSIASDFEVINEVGMIEGVRSTKDFVIDESLFDNNYAIAVGKAGRKVLVFDATIDEAKVAIYVSIDENNEVTNAQPFYSGTYSQMISDLETGKVDGYPQAAFFGDSFDHWAKK